MLLSLTLGSIEKKVPRRHQSLSEGSTLSAVYKKLLWDQPKFLNETFQIPEILFLNLETFEKQG